MRFAYVFMILSLLLSGCITGKKLRKDIESERLRLKTDESRGARICASYDLAMARSHLDFAFVELEEGNYLAAEEHLALEREHAMLVSQNADVCMDQDGDGVLDREDKCPRDPGPVENEGCPDRDGDGVLDMTDKCPDTPGIEKLNGCPDVVVNADSDNDGILDKSDQCPFDAEDKDGFKDQDGCPDLDNDNDGTADKVDKCPLTVGPATNQGCPIMDRDGDGVPDEVDSCPDVKEDTDGFEDNDGCPDPDNDRDEILDSEDRCPDDKGPKENNGCPVLDSDKDGVPDIVDKCKDVPEDKDGFEDNDGCPDLDNDQDGIADVDDKCPVTAGVKEQNGCPKKYRLIVVTAKKIELKQKIFFKTGRAVLGSRSYPLLREVADAIKSSPGIKKVVIEGHTDSSGRRNINMSLSKKRAEAVKKFLEKQGVDSSKLEAVGYGPDKPISSNRTRRGRAKNRRVEFKIEQ